MRRVSSLGFEHGPRGPRSSRSSVPNDDSAHTIEPSSGRDPLGLGLGLSESAVSLSGEDAFEYTRGDSASPIAWLDDG